MNAGGGGQRLEGVRDEQRPPGRLYFTGKLWPLANARPGRVGDEIRIVAHDGESQTVLFALGDHARQVWRHDGTLAPAQNEQPLDGRRDGFRAQAATVTADGSLWIAGASSVWDVRLHLVHVGSDGSIRSSLVSSERGEAYVSDIEPEPDGGVLLAVTNMGTIAIDGTPRLHAGYADPTVVRIEPSGARASWARSFPSSDGGFSAIWRSANGTATAWGTFQRWVRVGRRRIAPRPDRVRSFLGLAPESAGLVVRFDAAGEPISAFSVSIGDPVVLSSGSILVSPWTGFDTTVAYDGSDGHELWRRVSGVRGEWVVDESGPRETAWRVVEDDVAQGSGLRRVRLEEIGEQGPTGREAAITTQRYEILSVRQPWRALDGTFVIAGAIRNARWDAAGPIGFVLVLPELAAREVSLDRLATSGTPPGARCAQTPGGNRLDPRALAAEASAMLGTLRHALDRECGWSSLRGALVTIEPSGRVAAVRDLRGDGGEAPSGVQACVARTLLAEGRACAIGGEVPITVMASMPNAASGGR